MFKTLMTSLPPQWVCSIVLPLKWKAQVLKKKCLISSENTLLVNDNSPCKCRLTDTSRPGFILKLGWTNQALFFLFVFFDTSIKLYVKRDKSFTSFVKRKAFSFFNEGWSLQPAEMRPCQPFSAFVLSNYKKCNTNGEETAFTCSVQTLISNMRWLNSEMQFISYSRVK